MNKRKDAVPICLCGCGEPVRQQYHGGWSQWRPGHNLRGVAADPPQRYVVVGEQQSLLIEMVSPFPVLVPVIEEEEQQCP